MDLPEETIPDLEDEREFGEINKLVNESNHITGHINGNGSVQDIEDVIPDFRKDPPDKKRYTNINKHPVYSQSLSNVDLIWTV